MDVSRTKLDRKQLSQHKDKVKHRRIHKAMSFVLLLFLLDQSQPNTSPHRAPSSNASKRIAELREEHESLRKKIEQLEASRPLPQSFSQKSNVEAIQASLKSLFFSSNEGIKKRYVNYLVDVIEVKGQDVCIKGKTTALLNTLGQKENVGTGCLPVPTLGIEWLPEQDSNLRQGD